MKKFFFLALLLAAAFSRPCLAATTDDIRVKAEVDIPVISVGGFRTKSVMEAALKDGKCDMIAISRPFIREPDLVEKFKTGKADRAECISCNKCFDESGVKCNYRPKIDKKELPVPLKTSLALIEGGKEMSLPMMQTSGPGVMPDTAKARSSRSSKRKPRKTKRRNIMAIRKPLKKLKKCRFPFRKV